MRYLFFIRNQIVIFFILMFIGFEGFAQTPKSICVKPGLSLAFRMADDDKFYDYPASFYVGANLDFFHHKNFSLLTEGGFVTKSDHYLTRSDHYLYISPLFKVRWEFGRFIPFVYAGPRLDFVILTRSQREAGAGDRYNFCVFGFGSGIGIEYHFFPFGFVLGFANQYDISNVLNEDNMSSKAENYNHNTIILSLGMKAYFGTKE